MEKHGRHVGEAGDFLHYMDMKKFLKNLFLWNRWSDFKIISQECSFGDPFIKLFAKFWSVHKHGSGEWVLLALYGHGEILKKSFSLKPLVQFWNNFTGIFLRWPFEKLFVKVWSVNKHGFREWEHFALHGQFLKNLLLQNRWSEFGIFSQDCSLCDPFQKLLAKFWSVEKHGCLGGGFLHCLDFREMLQFISPLKPLVRFWNNFREMFLRWPFSKIVREILICQ